MPEKALPAVSFRAFMLSLSRKASASAESRLRPEPRRREAMACSDWVRPI